MTRKLLSVIIPAYNVENYIVECVDSLLAQIPAPNELIIVNDGSTDNTLARIQARFGNDPRVRIVSVENGGAGRARDHGIHLASGEYVFCCDPDDVVCEGFYTEFSARVVQYPALELFCFNSEIFTDGNPDDSWPKVQHTLSGLSSSQTVFRHLLRKGAYTSASWNYVLKKEIIDRFNLKYIERVHEDHCYTLDAFLRTRVAFVSENVYYRQRLRRGSLTQGVKTEGYFRQRYDAFIQSYEKMIKLTADLDDRSELRRLYLIHSFKLMIHLSLSSGRSVPQYVHHAIDYFGKNLKPGGAANWLLLRRPELYSNLLRIKRSLRKA
ncbi:glycosyltransferase family 2 protein [Erwinia persicina]|uniref:glycosyltransferase family 2 protein n=1 Tax=Erwinia persicina TaxID=55211 RepID=UPI001780B1EC|nr:glycosyltransferase family 2 protein [Erwinia persicina]MBD8161250.1 glycosyltransferase family 2 protein [Erwinia persicina]